MNFTVDFFKDEVRNGFYIPTAIKQGWAASLVVLGEIDRICRKHDIEYYADWGTFLGAVRHGGFVPWDDDLDICMKRDDYDKFRAVADIELPKEFVIHDYERKEDHQLFLARVVSSNQICFEEEHLNQYHNFPYMASVDIFILDYLYNDEEKERERCKEIKRIIAVADGILEGTLHKDTIDRELYFLEQKYNIKIDRRSDNRHIMIELYKLAEKQMARAPKEEAKRVGQIFPWVLKGSKGHPRKYYENPIRVPFENTTIPVPAEYNVALRNHYGNYLVCRKVWGGHDYPYFEKQRENLQAVADFKLPEFTFSEDMLSRPDSKVTYDDSLKGMAVECLARLKSLTDNLESQFDALPECQQLAVDLGTLIENVKGEEAENTKLVVDKLQSYCDALFELYNAVAGEAGSQTTNEENASIDDKLNRVNQSLDEVIEIVHERIINQKEILFITTGPKEWKGFEDIYDKLKASGEADIIVLPIPILFKDFFGRIIASDDEIIKATQLEDYPDKLKLALWTDYDITLHHPDRIYIQNPYDSENPCITVPTQFFAKELRKYTEELIYVQPFKTGEFSDEDYTDMANLKHYVTAPGVIYADKVLVQSENIREKYINKLTSFAGENTKKFWEEKILYEAPEVETKTTVEAKQTVKARDISTKKKLFYLIGLNEISEHENIEEHIKNRLDIFKENESNIDITVGMYPPDINTWKKVNSKLTGNIISLIEAYGHSVSFLEPDNAVLEAIVDEQDAYYGSASPLVTIFTYYKKPVMIADYDIN